MALTKAQTKFGTVSGVPAGKITAFLGIPFAKPPVGSLRFKAPEEPDKWDGELVCDTYSAACIQHPIGPGSQDMAISEDCLYLNIWTPADTVDDNLPVMFWIFGGGFMGGSGSSPEFCGENLSKNGVIVVTINYRCGPLGFFSLPSWDDRSGNLGLLDQVAALKWVYENISSFGGDPSRILVFGQSAGGVSTRCMLVSPVARRYVRRAVIESGGGLNEADPVRTKEEFQSLCSETLKELGWTEADIMERDPVEVMDALNAAGKKVLEKIENGRIVGVFQPYVDGYLLPDVPGKMIANGDYNTEADIICGTVSGDDWMFSRKVQQNIPSALGGTRAFSLIPGFSWGRHQIATKRSPIRTFYFDMQREEYKESKMYRPNTVPHGSEIPYVFGTLPITFLKNRKEDIEASDAMMRYWTNFAKTGDPNLPDNVGLPQWLSFTEECQEALLFTSDGIRMADLLRNESYIKLMDYTESHPGMLMSLDDFG